jgi:hypothetical protein
MVRLKVRVMVRNKFRVSVRVRDRASVWLGFGPELVLG